MVFDVYFAWWNCALPCLSLPTEKFYSILEKAATSVKLN